MSGWGWRAFKVGLGLGKLYHVCTLYRSVKYKLQQIPNFEIERADKKCIVLNIGCELYVVKFISLFHTRGN